MDIKFKRYTNSNDPILDAEIVGEALNRLCDQLGKDIEQQFEISLKTYGSSANA